MSQHKDSYIVRDINENDEEVISFTCEGCVEKIDESRVISFYPGATQGYGPFRFPCVVCGAIIYDGRPKGEE